MKARHRRAFIRERIEERIHPRHLKQVVDLGLGIEQFQFAARAAHGNVRRRHLAQTGAIQVFHADQIEENILVAFGQYALHCASDRSRAVVQRNAAGQIDDGHIARVAYRRAVALGFPHTLIMYNRG